MFKILRAYGVSVREFKLKRNISLIKYEITKSHGPFVIYRSHVFQKSLLLSWIKIVKFFLGWKQKICSVEVLIWFSGTRGSELPGLCWKRLGPGALQWGQPRVFSGARGNGILCQGSSTTIPKVWRWTERTNNILL